MKKLKNIITLYLFVISDVFELLTEIEYWSLIGFKNILTPNNIVTNATKIMRLHRNTSKIVNNYNTLIAGIFVLEYFCTSCLKIIIIYDIMN